MEEAAKARYNQGIAHRTDKEIMEETPAPVVRSVRIMAMATATEIGPEMSQNSFHSLKVFFFTISLSSITKRHFSWFLFD